MQLIDTDRLLQRGAEIHNYLRGLGMASKSKASCPVIGAAFPETQLKTIIVAHNAVWLPSEGRLAPAGAILARLHQGNS